MCGIVGFYSKKEITDRHKESVYVMNKAITHRGPDDEGFFSTKKVCLAMRRLSIIDIEGGHQPMHCEGVSIIYNGEVSNYIELRKELIEKGHNFKTKSDTEVILHSYLEWKEESFRKLNGMFAFAIWDGRRRNLYLVRDRFGIKPLIYSETNNGWVFSSEMQSILKWDISRELSAQAFNQYFSYYYLHSPWTIYKNILRLKPGHFIRIHNNEQKIESFWEPEYNTQKRSINEWEDTLEKELKNAVKRNLRSDVPLGVFLSGGMDSTSILAMMSLENIKNIDTFTIGFSEQDFDERPLSKLVARIYKTNHHPFLFDSKDVPDVLEDFTRSSQEPYGNWTSILNWEISRQAKKYVTVILRGDGGDEIFGGYPTYNAERFRRYLQFLPSSVRRNIIMLLSSLAVSPKYMSFEYKIKQFFRGLEKPFPISHLCFKEIFSTEEKENLFTKETVDWILENDNKEAFRTSIDGIHLDNISDRINKLMYIDIKTFLEGCCLYMADLTSMAYSLESRVPFLDNELVSCAQQIPSSLHNRYLDTKVIHRKTMKKLLAPEILKAPKHGFVLPSAEWFRRELNSFAASVLSKERIRKNPLLRDGVPERLLREHASGKKNNDRKLTALISFVLWYENCFL